MCRFISMTVEKPIFFESRNAIIEVWWITNDIKVIATWLVLNYSYLLFRPKEKMVSGKGLVFISGEIVYVYKNEIKMSLWKLDTETKFIIIMTLEVHLWIIVFWMQVLLKHVNENRNSYRRNVFYICRVLIGLDLSVLVTKCTPFFKSMFHYLLFLP